MSKIDWSKPIALYYRSTGAYYADASLISRDVAGGHPYIIKWGLPETPTVERVDQSTLCGSLLNIPFVVRNKPEVRRKYVSLSLTKAGGLVIDSFDAKEDADHRRAYRMSTGKYVVCNVFELEWTEE